MKLLYKPFAVIAVAIGGKLGQQLFRAMWQKFDGAEPPKPSVREASTAKVVGAAALEAATLAGAKAATSRASAQSFHYLTGFWPGDPADEERRRRKKKKKRD